MAPRTARARLATAWLGAAAIAVSWALPQHAGAESWTRRYINSLPDSAFAVVETAPDGKKLRHLPHHDRAGRLDPAHLRNAMSRLSQVKWLDPRDAATARQHLSRHLQEMLRSGGAPPR